MNTARIRRYLGRLMSLVLVSGLLKADDTTADQDSSSPSSNIEGDGEDVTHSVTDRTSLLWSSECWLEFKDVWRKISLIQPPGESDNNSENRYVWIQEIRQRLYSSAQELMETADSLGIDSLEVQLLKRLALDRLDRASYGTSVPMTRMAPPPVSYQTGNLVSQIDTRLDSIARLREAGLLDPEEFEPVFHSLKIALDSYLLLETVNMNTGYSGHLWGVSWPLEYDLIKAKLDSVETAIMDIDDTPQAYPDSMRQAMFDEIQHLKQELETTRNMFPAVHDLLIDLELF